MTRPLGAVALAAALAIVAPGRPEGLPLKKVVFLTNYVFLGRHAPFFVGVEKGFYRDAGFEVSIAPATGSAFVLSAIEAGQADYGIAEAASVVQAVGKGARVKAFGVFMDDSTSGLAALAAYPTPQSIIGKTVAASVTDSARVILPIVFRRAGLDPSAIAWVTADPSIYFALLLSGRADLVTASIDSDVVALARVAASRAKAVSFSPFASWGYDVFGYFLVARADRLAGSAAEVRAFAAATAKAVRYALEHPDEAARITSERSPALDYNTALEQWRASMKAVDTPVVRLRGYGHATAERLQRTIDLVKQAFALEARLTPADVFLDAFPP